MFMKDPSGQTLADYYARIMSYLVNGSMTDEHGKVTAPARGHGPSEFKPPHHQVRSHGVRRQCIVASTPWVTQ
jgi:hypothetical protein